MSAVVIIFLEKLKEEINILSKDGVEHALLKCVVCTYTRTCTPLTSWVNEANDKGIQVTSVLILHNNPKYLIF